MNIALYLRNTAAEPATQVGHSTVATGETPGCAPEHPQHLDAPQLNRLIALLNERGVQTCIVHDRLPDCGAMTIYDAVSCCASAVVWPMKKSPDGLMLFNASVIFFDVFLASNRPPGANW